jgi:phenylalanyl-tRNA synthetase beta subunit
MKISYQWLSEYFRDPLPSPEALAETITMHAFEVEGIEASGEDHILDIKILPNRAHDCLSYIGIAREVGVLLDREVREPDWTFAGDQSLKTADLLTLTVEDNKLCPRAMKRVAFDVVVGESPEWLRRKLEAHGQRSINSIVDITNLVMLETGQPVHAFDLDKLAGETVKNISIRNAREGETVRALDGKTYELDPEVLVISDYVNPLDIAGVKGGADSSIHAGTKNILLSVCNFEPIRIRKTAVRLGLHTDASRRFEQGISPILAERAMNRLSSLVRELAKGVVSDDVLDVYPQHLVRTVAPYKIGVSRSEVNSLLGTDLSDAAITDILDRFKHAGFMWKKVRPLEALLALAPTLVGAQYKYGPSVTFDAPEYFDCSSFVNYLHVQSGIALPRRTVDQYVFGMPIEAADLRPGDAVFSRHADQGETAHIDRLDKDQEVLQTESKDFLRGTAVPPLDHVGIYLGDGKIIHASGLWHKGAVVIEIMAEAPHFKNIVGYRRFIADDEERYVVEVPPERLDLRAGNGFLVSGNREDLIEEIGRIHGYADVVSVLPEVPTGVVLPHKHFFYADRIRTALVAAGFSELQTYAFTDAGEIEMENPIAEDKKYLRGSLVPGMGRALAFNAKYAPLLGIEDICCFEIGTVYSMEGERTMLALGVLKTGKKGDSGAVLLSRGSDVVQGILGTAENGTEHAIFAAELREFDLSAAIEALPALAGPAPAIEDPGISFKPLSPYPFALRDIAVFVPGETKPEEVAACIREAAGNLLATLSLFDTFRKETPEGMRVSYAFRLVFQSEEKTLSDGEVNACMAAVAEVLGRHDGWQVR